MCSSGDSTLKASEASSAAFQNTLQASFATTFGKNQAILDSLNKTLTDAVANPKGFDPRTLALMKSTASDTVARSTNAAQIAAGNYAASHGASDIGSGVQAQIAGSIGAIGAEENARELAGIDIQSGMLQNENYWRAIGGLTDVARAENPTAYAGEANTAGNTTANIGKAYLESKQADWNNAFGVVKGVAGLASAVAGMPGMPKFGGSTASGISSSPGNAGGEGV
jgi:hypothetical protein